VRNLRFLLLVVTLLSFPLLVGAAAPQANAANSQIGVQLIRHATMILDIQGKRIMVDPMFSAAGSMDGFPTVPHHQARNPMVDLPVSIDELCKVDAILVTHTHADHFDDAAIKALPKDIPLFCQPEDCDKISKAGFTKVLPVAEMLSWENIKINRVAARHGYGDAANWLAPVSGFVLSGENSKSVYLAGDTVWYKPVQDSLTKFKPDVTIVFSGAAQFDDALPITMTVEGIYELCQQNPKTHVVAVHMDAINHCILTKAQLRQAVAHTHLENQVSVPNDGEKLVF
jgi:L-ascorbate metabolism protein UlaG (beta-lactamase superfamily)